MKVFIWVTALISAGLAAPAWAADVGWYFGAGVGQSHFSSGRLNDLVPSGWIASSNETDTAYRLSAGYQVTPYLGLEAFYADLGRVTIDAHAPPGQPIPIDTENQLNGRVDAQGWGAAVKGAYPLTDTWRAYARAGLLDARVRFQDHGENGSVNPPIISITTIDVRSTNWKAAYGVGVEWDFSPQWSATLSWDQFHQLGDSATTGEYNVNLLAAGIVYRIF